MLKIKGKKTHISIIHKTSEWSGIGGAKAGSTSLGGVAASCTSMDCRSSSPL
jgi:hypothetical protein